MSRSRAYTVLSSLIATLAMTVGLLTFSAGAATARPKHYPPPAPVLVCNRPVVKYGVTVRITGRKYAYRERVWITISFRPKGSKYTRVVRRTSTMANSKGKFIVRANMSRAGLVFITAKGKRSHQSATVNVYVINKKKGHGGWWVSRAAYTGGVPGSGGGVSYVTPVSQDQPVGAWLAVAGVAAMGVAGSAMATRQTIRRRRAA
ncbi:hypothetical protein [Mangrovihabitans endophyticus]|nr:hypothetical protein [Mangrovihabitans endophyticus]